MPLVTLNDLLRHATANHYAVGYFEAWNLESVLAVKDAAERVNSPVIIGFNGGFLGNTERRIAEDIFHYGRLGHAIAVSSTVPMALILNEAGKVDMLIRGLDAGFNVIMLDHEGRSYDEFIRINKQLVQMAHGKNAAVEAEIGTLPSHDLKRGTITEGDKTDPDEALRFVGETGIDALAVSVGNVHTLEGRTAQLDFPLIQDLREKLPVYLVLHGGTGIDPEALKGAIQRGISKVNIGTVLRRTFINSLKSYYGNNDVDVMDPASITSDGGDKDMLCRARAEITDEVVKLINIFGSQEKAAGFFD